MKKDDLKNCWEIRKCGREKGGINVPKEGECPAATGKMGHSCWVVAGILSEGTPMCNFAKEDPLFCLLCEVYNNYAPKEQRNIIAEKFPYEAEKYKKRHHDLEKHKKGKQHKNLTILLANIEEYKAQEKIFKIIIDSLEKAYSDLADVHSSLEESNVRVKESELLFKTLFSSLASAVVIYEVYNDGEDFIFKDVNQAFEKIEKIKKDQVLGKSVTKVFPRVKEFGLMEVLRNVHRTGKLKHHPPTLYKDDRISGWRENHACRLSTGEVVVSYEDVTKRIEAELEVKKYQTHLEDQVRERTKNLERAKIEAEAANKAKSDFLSGISHELRTPLNGILGFTDLIRLIRKGMLTKKEDYYLAHIKESGKHLLALINDILDISKIEAGKMNVERTDVQLNKLLERSILLLTEKAASQQIMFVKELKGKINIAADETKTKQIIFNLLSNAIKFTPDGGKITVSAKTIKNKLVMLSICDTGIGIEDKEKEKVFRKFEQIDSGHIRRFGGTGLGMPLTKRLVEMHGGKIWFESEGKDKGTCFFVLLPLNQGCTIDEEVMKRYGIK